MLVAGFMLCMIFTSSFIGFMAEREQTCLELIGTEARAAYNGGQQQPAQQQPARQQPAQQQPAQQSDVGSGSYTQSLAYLTTLNNTLNTRSRDRGPPRLRWCASLGHGEGGGVSQVANHLCSLSLCILTLRVRPLQAWFSSLWRLANVSTWLELVRRGPHGASPGPRCTRRVN